MTTNEIKTLIQNTIAGQGSQVDIGGKLAEVLNALADAVGNVRRTVVLQINNTGQEMTEEQFLASFTIDGEPATREKFYALNPERENIIAIYDGFVFGFAYLSYDEEYRNYAFGVSYQNQFGTVLSVSTTFSPGGTSEIRFYEN